MRRIWIVALAGASLLLWVPPADAATPTRLVLTTPSSVGVGEDITIDAQLVTVDGRPVPGAVLTLSQVGVVGQRVMQRVKTDEKGAASFLHNEFTLAHLAVRVAFAGDAQFASAAADAEIAIAGVEVPPAVPMSHAPGLVVKAALFSVLGAVWITYLFAASCIVRVVRDGRGAKGGETLRRGRSSAITP